MLKHLLKEETESVQEIVKISDGCIYLIHSTDREDKEYWDILQVMSKALKAGVDLVGLRYRLWEYARRDK